MAADDTQLPEGFEELPPQEQLKLARDKAKVMLEKLVASKAETEAKLRSEGRAGNPGVITGRHAMDQAIASTKRMVEALDALCQDMGIEEK